MAQGLKKKYYEGTGASIEIPPDPKYTKVHKLCETERKNGIQEQIKQKLHEAQMRKQERKHEQDSYNKHWKEVNEKADLAERQKRVQEAHFVTEEMQKLQARRLREYAQTQIEKERVRKMNQKMNEKYNSFDTKKRQLMQQQKNEIRIALDEQIRQKQHKAAHERRNQKLVINS